MTEAIAILGGVLIAAPFFILLFTNPPRPRRKRK